jgi:hypothetical protein
MDQLVARQLINNGWFITSLCLVVIFIAFLAKEMREDGWYGKLRNQAALALIVYFTGETVARLWGMLLLRQMAGGLPISDAFAIEEKYPIAMGAACLSFIGAICCVRIFSPPSWGHRGWLSVLGIAAVFLALTYPY